MTEERKEKIRRWLAGDTDVLADILDSDERPYRSREEEKQKRREIRDTVSGDAGTRRIAAAERQAFRRLYVLAAVACCLLLTGVLLYTVSLLPRYGQENPQTTEVVRRYVEDGVEETGAINIVAGMILDYRAFDTLGESHVLFTALVCVMALLGLDKKNTRTDMEDYYRIRRKNRFRDLTRESILRESASLLIPCIGIYALYILLNGQNGPGGGFSGGAVAGAGLIIASAAFGFETMDRFLTAKVCGRTALAALGFYSFTKGFVFFVGANGLENPIPKGTPGAILSGGLILPLDIAVGIVVALTMYGFYSLFRRGSIGGAWEK